MTTTLSYLLGDKFMLANLAVSIMNRRRQLVPFPLNEEELIDVQHNPRVANVIRFLRLEKPKAIMWHNSAMFELLTPEHPIGKLQVHILSKAAMPLAVNNHGPSNLYDGSNNSWARVVCDGELVPRLKVWAWAALKIEMENRWVLNITNQLFEKAGTHQQVHRFMPELYAVMAQESQPQTRGRAKLLYETLGEVGSKRARKLDIEGISVEDRSKVQNMLAQALILPVHQGNSKGTQFDQTWIHRA